METDGNVTPPKDRKPTNHMTASNSSVQERTFEQANVSQTNTSHILEIYDFSTTVRTADLEKLLAAYTVHIVWIDDTHAFAIFANGDQALHAYRFLSLTPSEYKTRPFSDSNASAKRVYLQKRSQMDPPAIRPRTTAVVARRLITGALGTKLPQTEKSIREEREFNQEIQKKRQSKKSDVWND